MDAWWQTTIKFIRSLELAVRMEETSQGAERKDLQPWKFVGVLTAGTGSALMSVAVLQARMSLMEGVVKLREAVMDGIVMLTTVACSFTPTKHTNLLARQKGVPPMFLKLWRTVTVLFKFAARKMMFASLLKNAFFSIGEVI